MTDDRIPDGAQPTPDDGEPARAAEARRRQEELDELEARAADDFYHDRPLADSAHVAREAPVEVEVDVDARPTNASRSVASRSDRPSSAG